MATLQLQEINEKVIQHTPDVCGGNTSIHVWTLVSFRPVRF